MAELRAKAFTQIRLPVDGVTPALRQEVRKQLLALKKEYIQSYVELHTRARLGAAEDKRKGKLLQDERLNTLRKLATIDLMPAHQLADFQDRLAGLRSCFNLTEQDLSGRPVCPHCGFVPSKESVDVPAASVLEALDEELDNLLEAWTRALIDNLDDPTTRQNLELLKPEAKAMVEEFLRQRRLPVDPGPDFIQAIREVLSGLTKVVVRTSDLKAALTAGGSPATPAEIMKRFEDYLNELIGARDPPTVRIVLE